jgi:TetR/AcrR family transcriptional regulator, transcriptional repressor for nem operon
MSKPSHREKLLAAGLHVVLEQGYCGASVRDIVQAAGVPQGSFTNHFRSKEAFSLEVLERYFTLVLENIDKTLRNDSEPPLERLRKWVDLQIRYLEQAGNANGKFGF